MICYRFHEVGGRGVVITGDITGSNFPRVEKGWRADGRTEIKAGDGKRLGVEARVILEAIEQDGYFLGSLNHPER